MREIDHLAAMALMGLLANPMTHKLKRKSIILNAYEIAEEFITVAHQKQDEETERLKKKNDELMRKHNP